MSPTVTRRPLVLVSCVGPKRGEPSPAKDLYTSVWFVKARAYAERVAGSDRDWAILSALHGVVLPGQVIGPYEYTLNTLPIAERKRWANRVMTQLTGLFPLPHRDVTVLAGDRYRQFLVPRLKCVPGCVVVVPMEGLGIGKQLAWLDNASKETANQ